MHRGYYLIRCCDHQANIWPAGTPWRRRSRSERAAIGWRRRGRL